MSDQPTGNEPYFYTSQDGFKRVVLTVEKYDALQDRLTAAEARLADPIYQECCALRKQAAHEKRQAEDELKLLRDAASEDSGLSDAAVRYLVIGMSQVTGQDLAWAMRMMMGRLARENTRLKDA